MSLSLPEIPNVLLRRDIDVVVIMTALNIRLNRSYTLLYRPRLRHMYIIPSLFYSHITSLLLLGVHMLVPVLVGCRWSVPVVSSFERYFVLRCPSIHTVDVLRVLLVHIQNLWLLIIRAIMTKVTSHEVFFAMIVLHGCVQYLLWCSSIWISPV